MVLNQAFDKESISNLLFLKRLADEGRGLEVSGDGVLKFAHLIGAGLADFNMKVFDARTNTLRYSVLLSDKGRAIVNAWFSGDRAAVQAALNPSTRGQ